MDPFIGQLASLCREHPTRSKWVFVPTHAVGRTIGERIALEGTNWLNLRFVTPLDIALRMGAPFRARAGVGAVCLVRSFAALQSYQGRILRGGRETEGA